MNCSISIFEHRLVLSVCSRRMGRTEEGVVVVITSVVPSKKTRDISGETVSGEVARKNLDASVAVLNLS
jgi:hypothetical protein